MPSRQAGWLLRAALPRNTLRTVSNGGSWAGLLVSLHAPVTYFPVHVVNTKLQVGTVVVLALRGKMPGAAHAASRPMAAAARLDHAERTLASASIIRMPVLYLKRERVEKDDLETCKKIHPDIWACSLGRTGAWGAGAGRCGVAAGCGSGAPGRRARGGAPPRSRPPLPAAAGECIPSPRALHLALVLSRRRSCVGCLRMRSGRSTSKHMQFVFRLEHAQLYAILCVRRPDTQSAAQSLYLAVKMAL